MFRTSSVHQQERLLQAVCADLVCGNARTTRRVQPLQSCKDQQLNRDEMPRKMLLVFQDRFFYIVCTVIYNADQQNAPLYGTHWYLGEPFM